MYYLSAYQTGQFGYVHTLATATEWDAWLVTVIPNVLDANVRSRLHSNLKHILVGMEMKAGLITPHATRGAGNASVLFEPYYTVMIFEFCVGAFSVCEGLGTAFRLRDVGNNGANAPRIAPNHWIASLVAVADPNGNLDLEAKVRGIKSVRNKMHQDRLGARQEIDWHAFSFDDAFLPAKSAILALLQIDPHHVPAATNLTA